VTKRDSAYIQKKGEREGIGVRERGGEGRAAGREGSGGGGDTPENGLAQLRRLAGGESAG